MRTVVVHPETYVAYAGKQRDPLEECSVLFGPPSHAHIVRLLERATERAINHNKKVLDAAFRRSPPPNRRGGILQSLAAHLNLAVRLHANARGPSRRLTAPDTGGRTFHLSHVSVTPRTIRLGKRELGKLSRRNQRAQQPTSDGATHMAYLEREDAVEVWPNPGAETLAAGKDPLDGQQSRGDFGFGREAGISTSTMQAYIENEEKVAGNAEESATSAAAHAFSFGTIGETPEERMGFWDLVEAHAERDNAVLQHRWIFELPKEATPPERLEIMKAVGAWYEARGIPYWIVLHAPTDKNDPRNYHAHAVTLARPAKKVCHPKGGDNSKPGEDGKPKQLVDTWDFAATTRRPDQYRVTRTRYPHRQQVHPDMRRCLVKNERARFAEIVNRVMEKGGHDVRFDPRSHVAMGLDVPALRSITRAVGRQIRSGSRLADDTGIAKRSLQVAVETYRTAGAIEIEKLVRAEERVRRAGQQIHSVAKANRYLPKHMQVSPLARMSKTAVLVLGKAVLTAQRDRIRARIADEVKRLTLQRVVDATDPEALARRQEELRAMLANSSDKRRPKLLSTLEALPSPADIGVLHTSALAELADHDREAAARRFAHQRRSWRRLEEWRAVAERTPGLPALSRLMPELARLKSGTTPPQVTNGDELHDCADNAKTRFEGTGAPGCGPEHGTHRVDPDMTSQRAKEILQSALRQMSRLEEHPIPENTANEVLSKSGLKPDLVRPTVPKGESDSGLSLASEAMTQRKSGHTESAIAARVEASPIRPTASNSVSSAGATSSETARGRQPEIASVKPCAFNENSETPNQTSRHTDVVGPRVAYIDQSLSWEEITSAPAAGKMPLSNSGAHREEPNLGFSKWKGSPPHSQSQMLEAGPAKQDQDERLWTPRGAIQCPTLARPIENTASGSTKPLSLETTSMAGTQLHP